jgi:hypothetical protein
MKRVLFVLPFAVLVILLGTARPVSAKAASFKITISGGGLAHPVEVQDPQILNLSNIWLGQFLDSTRGRAKAPPRELPRYEVSFYVKFNERNTPRRMYVAYYRPDPAGGRGTIYLPGRGEAWHDLNVSSILRDGQDGKWNYASAAWEDLIKPVIARAAAAPPHSS